MTACQVPVVRPSCKWVILTAGLLSVTALIPVVFTFGQTPAHFYTSPRTAWSQPSSVSSQTGHVAYTLALTSNALIPGNFLPGNGFDPVAVAVDSRNGYLYVADAGSNNPELLDFSRNVTVINGATNKVIGGIGVGDSPDGLAFDGSNGYLYVANSGSDNVTVIDGATNKVVAWIPVGSHPGGSYPAGIAFDNFNGYLYVTDFSSYRVTVIDGATNKVVASIPVGSYPQGVAFDGANKHVYVTNGGVAETTYLPSVAVIDAATNAVVAWIPVGSSMGSFPAGITFDSTNGYLYVANSGSDNVTVIDGATNKVIGGIGVRASPHGIAFDSTNGNVYVTNTGSNDVTVIDGATNKVVGWIPVGLAPEDIVFDGSNGYVYVTIRGSDNVAVIDGATNRVIKWVPVPGPAPSIPSGLGSAPQGIAFDSSNGYLYVTEAGSNNVTVIDGATNTIVTSIPVGSYPFGVAFDSTNGYIYVTDYHWASYLHSNVTVIDGATNKVVGSIPVGAAPIDVAFDTTNGYLYVANAASSDVTVIDSATNKVVASIPLTSSPAGLAFDSFNGYLYVSAASSDYLTVIDGATSKVIGSITVGLYPNGIAFDAVNGYLYTANSGTGSTAVIDGATNSVIGWIPSGLAPLRIAFDRTNGYLYLTNVASGSVSIFSGSMTVSADASRTRADVGQAVLFTCTPTGGASPYSLLWTFGDGDSSNQQVVSHTYARTGDMTATCTVVDGVGTLGGRAMPVIVSSSPTVTLLATPSSFLAGKGVAFSAKAQGGWGPYSYNWSDLPPGCGGAANSPNYACTPTSAGNYNVRITVTDSNGMTASSDARITANPSFLGMPAAVGYEVMATIVAVPAIGVLIAVVWLRHRRKSPAPSYD